MGGSVVMPAGRLRSRWAVVRGFFRSGESWGNVTWEGTIGEGGCAASFRPRGWPSVELSGPLENCANVELHQLASLSEEESALLSMSASAPLCVVSSSLGGPKYAAMSLVFMADCPPVCCLQAMRTVSSQRWIVVED